MFQSQQEDTYDLERTTAYYRFECDSGDFIRGTADRAGHSVPPVPGRGAGPCRPGCPGRPGCRQCIRLATLSFSIQEDGTWVWDDDTEFPLDDSTIRSIMDLLSDLTPQQVLSDPESLESYELDAPSASISAVKADQSTVSVTFGKATTDGTSRYATMNGDSSTVYIFADTLYQALQTPIYDMMTLPELPVLTESSIASISIQGPGEDAEPLLLAAQHTDSATTWLSGGEDVTGNATVQALLEDLEQLEIARCVDYRPSEEAASICGFDDPDALVQVTYTPEGGSESVLTLTVGNPEPDGTGRYARVGADTTIYLLETALLDPLMRVAAGGLSS